VADLVLQHPRIFEYKVDETTTYLTKGRARIQVGPSYLSKGKGGEE